jgi:hypothetical protein
VGTGPFPSETRPRGRPCASAGASTARPPAARGAAAGSTRWRSATPCA